MVTLESYKSMMRDRPIKFTASEVNFEEKAKDAKMSCGTCFHYYVGINGNGRNRPRTVCEIMRLHPERNVPASAECDFWTRNGIDFPLLEKT